MKQSNVCGAKGPFCLQLLHNQEGKDEMTKASVNLQDLRRRIYLKAKAEKSWRFWGLYVHVCKMETLREAYTLAKQNVGAPSDLRAHRNARRRWLPRADSGRTESAQLCAAAGSKAGNTEGRGQSPRSFDSGDSGSGGARGAQAHIGADLRGRLPTGIVWISSQADSS